MINTAAKNRADLINTAADEMLFLWTGLTWLTQRQLKCYFQLLIHSQASSSPSPHFFSHSPSHIPPFTVPSLFDFSIIFAKRTERVAVYMELNCAVRVDIDTGIVSAPVMEVSK